MECIGMKRQDSLCEQVDISSDEEDKGPGKSFSRALFPEAADVIISEDAFLVKAECYQEYMRQIPIPSLRGSVVPFNSWTELGMSLKELYKQPLHYLTNIHLRRLDQIRVGSSTENVPLDTIFLPQKAEANIWLMEEVHRISSSPCYLAEHWRKDPLYHTSIDSFMTLDEHILQPSTSSSR